MLALHLLQICLVCVNTLFIQEVLADPAWRDRMTAEDWRGLTPLIYHRVNPVWPLRARYGDPVGARGVIPRRARRSKKSPKTVSCFEFSKQAPFR